MDEIDVKSTILERYVGDSNVMYCIYFSLYQHFCDGFIHYFLLRRYYPNLTPSVWFDVHI
jgi:hypothetical protein